MGSRSVGFPKRVSSMTFNKRQTFNRLRQAHCKSWQTSNSADGVGVGGRGAQNVEKQAAFEG